MPQRCLINVSRLSVSIRCFHNNNNIRADGLTRRTEKTRHRAIASVHFEGIPKQNQLQMVAAEQSVFSYASSRAPSLRLRCDWITTTNFRIIIMQHVHTQISQIDFWPSTFIFTFVIYNSVTVTILCTILNTKYIYYAILKVNG